MGTRTSCWRRPLWKRKKIYHTRSKSLRSWYVLESREVDGFGDPSIAESSG